MAPVALRVRGVLAVVGPTRMDYSQALSAVANKTIERGTGARGLRAVLEEVMLDIMFELPDQPQGTTYVVNEAIVEGRDKLFPLTEPKTKSA